jgi:hypothetical protein
LTSALACAYPEDLMRRSRFKSLFAACALALVACLGLMVAEESFVHTDDGCAVEIHCLACRLAVTGTATTGGALSPRTLLAPSGAVEAAATRPAVEPPSSAPLSRGPPRSL